MAINRVSYSVTGSSITSKGGVSYRGVGSCERIKTEKHR